MAPHGAGDSGVQRAPCLEDAGLKARKVLSVTCKQTFLPSDQTAVGGGQGTAISASFSRIARLDTVRTAAPCQPAEAALFCSLGLNDACV